MFNQFISGDTATQTAGRIPEESTNKEKYNYYLKKALSIKRISLPAELNEDYEKISSHNTYLTEELLELETETNPEELSEPEILEVPPKEIKKHDLNIYPAMDEQDFLELKEDIRLNGYDKKYPIWLYQGGILDGWNRIQICAELNIKPVYQTFIGNDSDALAFVLRSNHRRNLTSDQRACLAADYNSIYEKIKKEAKERQIEGGKNKVRQKIAEPNRDANKTDSKVAKIFGTNRTYVQKAKRIKKENPEMFEKIKKGEENFSSIDKERDRTTDNGFHAPTIYEKKVKAVFFNPDFKPTTSDGSQETCQTATTYIFITNELDKQWDGNVYLSIPDLTTGVDVFIDKFIEEYDSGHLNQGIVYASNLTHMVWFHKLLNIAQLVCFTSYKGEKSHLQGQKAIPKHGNAFFYIGKNEKKFIEEFSDLGTIMKMVGTKDIENSIEEKVNTSSLRAIKHKIEWTEKTWNPSAGCTKISSGCKNCYAERMANRLQAMGMEGYENGFKFNIVPSRLNDPLKRKKATVYFVNSMSDIFHPDMPEDYLDKIFEVITNTPHHTYQILTKRADRMFQYLSQREIPKNIWLGVTVDNRKEGLPRIDKLRNLQASVLFLSVEPLLEDLGKMNLKNIDWVIVGGESGNNARPMDKEWVENIKQQCEVEGVAFFFKQWGTWGEDKIKRIKKLNGKELDGKIWQQYPKIIEQEFTGI